MTHTLHRQGDVESLKKDYAMFAMPSSGLNSEGSKEKLLKCYEIFMKYDPVNVGDSKGGSQFSLGSAEAVKEAIVENELIQAVFRSREQLINVLRDLKEADLGLSVTISGLIDHVDKCCQETGLEMHTINNSLGVWGDKDRLPDDKVLEISTMCGHGLVSFNLIFDLAEKVKKGKLSPEKAGEKLAEPCICGVFNPARAAELIEEMSKL